MKTLKRAEYKKFVEDHILRPYQTDISKSDKPLNFNIQWYNSIPALVEDNDEWQECVFGRISKIYDFIESDYFPVGPVGHCILAGMKHHGVKII